jgi:hypothetical protein
MARSGGLGMGRPQVASTPLHCAPVQQLLSPEALLSPLSSRPECTRISYFALLVTTTCAALREESRMQTLKATALHRKSGGTQWRDLCVDALSWKCFRQSGNCRATPRPTLVPAAGRRSRGLSPSGNRSGRRLRRVPRSCWSLAIKAFRRSSEFAVWQRTLPVPST